MIEIMICDDMPLLVDRLAEQITALSEERNLAIHISKFYSGEEIAFHIEAHPDLPDIIFLDILMKGLNGIDTARKLRKYGCNAVIIFLTSTTEYVFDSFDVEPLNYLLKDNVNASKLQEVMTRALEHVKENLIKYFTFEVGRETKQIPMKEISYFEVMNRIITIHHGDESIDFYSRLDQLEQELSPHCFVRTHRSYLVNTNYIQAFSSNSVTLLDKTEIPMGPSYVASVKKAFSNHFFH